MARRRRRYQVGSLGYFSPNPDTSLTLVTLLALAGGGAYFVVQGKQSKLPPALQDVYNRAYAWLVSVQNQLPAGS